jgi:photosystem II stability/assembly factor-like uncharacterized protein
MPPVRWLFASAATLLALAVTFSAAAPVPRREIPAGANPEALLRALSWRSVGPAIMGGRISAIAADPAAPATVWVGLGTGGVFKSTNLGTTWTPVFDRQPVASIGAIALWDRDADVVWVGTGEANSRNSSSWGNGIYRSVDGGATWAHLGLAATHNIARVVPHPADSAVAYVAALGRLWGENPERGVYRTTDGGRSWSHVLKVDPRTGAVDLVMDPSDPEILYAAMYSRRRTPWSYESGGESGGIFRTRDGGRTWTRLTEGLPRRTGRIGLAVYAANPRVVYAVIESDEGGYVSRFEDKSRTGGVFRSDDRGDHWTRLNDLVPRPFYYGQIRVQPDDSTRVYLPGTDLWISDDGGHTFRGWGARNLHPDCHDLWVGPQGGRLLMLGTDGGLFLSHDRGATWDFVNNFPSGEYYNIALDDRDPYLIYGGLQDNQSWGGPSRTRFEVESWLEEDRDLGILNDHWFCLGGGDGFHVAIEPGNPDIVYWESQGGSMVRTDLATGIERRLKPVPQEGEPELRFNWNTPFQISPHDPTVLWMGANRLLRLEARGERWSPVSPDLTTQDPRHMATGGSGAEQYCTITTLCESPRRAGLVWVGTDDGRVWLTPDGGGAWTEVTARVRGIPPGLYVSRIEASHHDERTAYLAIDGHRSDDFAPHLFVTRDLGRSWTSIAGDLPPGGPVKVVREDRVNPSLLFAGTEFGIFTSLDAGRHWTRMDRGLPTVAVDDIAIHPRERDLVIGTHGRSLWVMDDIGALQQWSPEVARDTVTLFAPRAVTAYQIRGLGAIFGQRTWAAKNPPFGASFDYHLAREVEGGVSLTVRDSAGRTVRTLRGPGRAGLHRVTWDLVAGEPRERIDRPEWNEHPDLVPPGRYTVTLACERARPRQQTVEVRRAPPPANRAR